MKTVKLGEMPKLEDCAFESAIPTLLKVGDHASADEVYENCKNYMAQVVEMFYAAYSDYVDKSDLYSQACLTMMTAYDKGVFTNAGSTFISFGRDLIMDLHLYCVNEMGFADDRIIVRTQDLTKLMSQTRETQSAVENSVIELLNSLSDEQRRVVIEHFIGNVSVEEIAEETNTSTGSICEMIHKALELLRLGYGRKANGVLMTLVDSGVM